MFKNGDSGVGYYFDRLNPYLALAAKKAVASLSTSVNFLHDHVLTCII